MARPAKFEASIIAHAGAAGIEASTLRELRKHQSVILSADQGLDMDATAAILGDTPAVVGKFQQEACNPDAPAPVPRGSRKLQSLNIEEEKEFLAAWIIEATTAGMTIVPPLQAALGKHLKKGSSLPSLSDVGST